MKFIEHEDKSFDKIDFSEKNLPKSSYTNCIFNNCNFFQCDLSGNSFMDCTFIACNLSMVSLTNTSVKNLHFRDCKLVGIDFGKANPFLFSVSFEECQLDYAIFSQLKLKKTVFSHCSLKEAEFENSDLSMVVFKECNLWGASFIQTILEKADFTTAINYAFDPEKNRIKKAKFSLPAVTGLLSKYDIEIE